MRQKLFENVELRVVRTWKLLNHLFETDNQINLNEQTRNLNSLLSQFNFKCEIL